MVRVSQVYRPRPDQSALYDKLYRRVYKKLYDRLHPLYQEIRSIVNYPERATDEPADD
jgi:hypothetical protein